MACITINVGRCSRCGEKHLALPFFEFEKRFMKVGDVVYTHWAYCPKNLEPIIATIDSIRGDNNERG